MRAVAPGNENLPHGNRADATQVRGTIPFIDTGAATGSTGISAVVT